MKTLLLTLVVAAEMFAQTKAPAKGKDASKLHGSLPTGNGSSALFIDNCVEPVAAYGGHVRWSTEDHIRILLDIITQRNKQDFPYKQWEWAAQNLDWFSGARRVSLAEIKGHMPRAMLLELRFPVDQNPPVDPKGYQYLLDTEKAYEAVAHGAQDFMTSLLKKYNLGPQATLDEDYGGATAFGGCSKYERIEGKTQ